MADDQVLQLRASAEQRQIIDQAAAAEGISRTEFILRSCQERARDVLLERTLFSLAPPQTKALLADLEDSSAAAQDRATARHGAALASARLSPSARSISWKASTAATPR